MVRSLLSERSEPPPVPVKLLFGASGVILERGHVRILGRCYAGMVDVSVWAGWCETHHGVINSLVEKPEFGTFQFPTPTRCNAGSRPTTFALKERLGPANSTGVAAHEANGIVEKTRLQLTKLPELFCPLKSRTTRPASSKFQYASRFGCGDTMG